MLNSICIIEVHCSFVEREHRYVGNKAKGRISKRVFQENKARQIFRKKDISYPLIRKHKNEHFLPPDTQTYVCVSWGKKCSFFGKFGVLCFLETPFCLITDVFLYYTLRKNRYFRLWRIFLFYNCGKICFFSLISACIVFKFFFSF